jgi:hypothetical protein
MTRWREMCRETFCVAFQQSVEVPNLYYNCTFLWFRITCWGTVQYWRTGVLAYWSTVLALFGNLGR